MNEVLPNEIFYEYILPNLAVRDLLNLSEVNKHFALLVADFLAPVNGGRRIVDEEYGLNNLYLLAPQYPKYKKLVIEEILHRLRSTKKRDLLLKLLNVMQEKSLDYINFYNFLHNYNIRNNLLLKSEKMHIDDTIIKYKYLPSDLLGFNPDYILNATTISETIKFNMIDELYQHHQLDICEVFAENIVTDEIAFFENYRTGILKNPNLTIKFIIEILQNINSNIIDKLIINNVGLDMIDLQKLKYYMNNKRKIEMYYFSNPNQTSKNLNIIIDKIINNELINFDIIENIFSNNFNRDPCYIYLANKIINKIINNF